MIRYLGSKTGNPAQSIMMAMPSQVATSILTLLRMRCASMMVLDCRNLGLAMYLSFSMSTQQPQGRLRSLGSDDNSATLSYTVDNLQVVMNGVVLDPTDFTATNGTSVVLDSGATVGDQVNIYAYKSFTTWQIWFPKLLVVRLVVLLDLVVASQVMLHLIPAL